MRVHPVSSHSARVLVSYLYLASFSGGLLLAVRLMFFGAERRRLAVNVLPLRRSEPAAVAFLIMFGIAGYFSMRQGHLTSTAVTWLAALLGAAFAAIVTWLAIATARIRPEHDPNDPRYVLQGRVGVVMVAIPAHSEGMIRYEDSGSFLTVRARDIGHDAIALGEEVCIERIEDGVAHVERWSLVEQRL